MIFVAVAQGLACLYVLLVCVLILNRMSHQTRIAIMLPFIAITVGSASGVVLAAANKGGITECLMAVGLALYLAFNERGRNVT